MDVELTIDLASERGRRRDRHASELEMAMYRIVQEVLGSAIKHGNARRLAVEIEEDHTTVRVTVHDDGDGFDPTTNMNGDGLLGMQARAELLGRNARGRVRADAGQPSSPHSASATREPDDGR